MALWQFQGGGWILQVYTCCVVFFIGGCLLSALLPPYTVSSLSDPEGDMRAFPEKRKEEETSSSPGASKCSGSVGCIYYNCSFPAARLTGFSTLTLGSRSLNSVPGKRSCLVHPGNSKRRMGAQYLPYLRCPSARVVGSNLKHLLILCHLGVKVFHSILRVRLDTCMVLDLMCASSAQIKYLCARGGKRSITFACLIGTCWASPMGTSCLQIECGHQSP